MDEITPEIPVQVGGRKPNLNVENQVFLKPSANITCTLIKQINIYLFFNLQVLLTLIWLRKYPTLHHLASQFEIPVTCVHRIIHKLLPLFHVVLVPKYIIWHSQQNWQNLAGTIPQWPNVVAILDGTPLRISRPAGF